MRRLRVRDDKFDGPLINPKTTIGKWLYHELVHIAEFKVLDTTNFEVAGHEIHASGYLQRLSYGRGFSGRQGDCDLEVDMAC